MAEETGMKDETLSVMTAVFNSEVYAKRFKELLDIRNETAALKEAADHANAQAQETLAEARRLHQEAEDARAGAAALVADFNERNKGLEHAITTHNDEVSAFGAMRSETEQGHRNRQEELDNREARLQKLAADLEDREQAVTDQHGANAKRDRELAEREGRLADIVAQLSPKAA